MKKIAWGITGAGDLIHETYETMVDIKKRAHPEIMVFLSEEAKSVLKWYKIMDCLKRDFPGYKVASGPNAPFIAGALQAGHYDLLLIAPATANTVAKIVHGIADSLVTNAVAMAAKGDTPIFILPVDQVRGTIKTFDPDGKAIYLKMREIDLENTGKLSRMENISVIKKPADIYGVLGLDQ
jgi:archaeoflavoprotein AfpA